jgi:hypothetical protein
VISIFGVSKTFLQANMDTVNALSIEKITLRRHILSGVDRLAGVRQNLLSPAKFIPAKLPSNPARDRQN